MWCHSEPLVLSPVLSEARPEPSRRGSRRKPGGGDHPFNPFQKSVDSLPYWYKKAGNSYVQISKMRTPSSRWQTMRSVGCPWQPPTALLEPRWSGSAARARTRPVRSRLCRWHPMSTIRYPGQPSAPLRLPRWVQDRWKGRGTPRTRQWHVEAWSLRGTHQRIHHH